MNKKSNKKIIIIAILIIIAFMILGERRKTEVLAQLPKPAPGDVGGGFNLGFHAAGGVYYNYGDLREKLYVGGGGIVSFPKPGQNKELTYPTLDDKGKLIIVDSGLTVGFIFLKNPPTTLISGDEKQGEIKIGTKLYVITEFSHDVGVFGGPKKVFIEVKNIENGRIIFDAKDFHGERIPKGTPMYFVEDQGPGTSPVAGIYTGSFLPVDQQKIINDFIASSQKFFGRPYLNQIPENLFDTFIDWFNLTETEQERLRKEYNKITTKLLNGHLGTMIRTQDVYAAVGSSMPGVIDGEHIKSLPIINSIDGKDGVILTTNEAYLGRPPSNYPPTNFAMDLLSDYWLNNPGASVPVKAQIERPVLIRAPILDYKKLSDGTYAAVVVLDETTAMSLEDLKRVGFWYIIDALGGYKSPKGQPSVPGNLPGPVIQPPTTITPGFPGGGGSSAGPQIGPTPSGPGGGPTSGGGPPQSGPGGGPSSPSGGPQQGPTQSGPGGPR